MENDNVNPNCRKKGLGDDLRQSYMVMKNELVKFFRGRKILLFLVLIGLVLGLLTFLPYLLGHSLPKDKNALSALYITFIQIVTLLSVTLFTSTQIVSEFEERTALILFTRPIRKTSIFLGKMAASLLMGALFVSIYYAASCLVSLVIAGGIGGGMLKSYGLALLFVFTLSGMSMAVSSITKKASTSAMLTFFVIVLISPVVANILSSSGIASWWTLENLGDSISNVLDGYAVAMASMSMETSVIDAGRSAGMMVVWGLVYSAIALAVFKKRDF